MMRLAARNLLISHQLKLRLIAHCWERRGRTSSTPPLLMAWEKEQRHYFGENDEHLAEECKNT
eukprot:12329588-Ditylum_brightwellii.AAC.1